MEVVYKEVRITYDESEDDWGANLVGIPKRFGSLKAAKKAIDYITKKAFERIECYVRRGGWGETRAYQKGTITSQSATGEIWITFSSKDREKFRAYGSRSIVGDTPDNVLILKEITTLEEQQKEIRKQLEELEKKLEPALKE